MEQDRSAELEQKTDADLREILKIRGVKFFTGAKRKTLIAKVLDSDGEPAIQPGAAQDNAVESEVQTVQESPATVNVETMEATPEPESAEFKALIEKVETKQTTFNPDTHLVVNKARFEQLMFNLMRGDQALRSYTRQASMTRLAELLELPGGEMEARGIFGEYMKRVMAGA